MKKIILTTIVCFFFSLIGYAQNSALDKFFDKHAESEGTIYIFNGDGKCLYKCLPADLKKALSSVKFSKQLSSKEFDTGIIKELKELLMNENYELTKRIKNDQTNLETYQKISESNYFEQITLTTTPVTAQLRWISGKMK